MIKLDLRRALPFLDPAESGRFRAEAAAAHRTLLDRIGEGSDALGWRDLLRSPDPTLLEEIDATAREIRERADVLLCIGIGGSYLGAKAVIQALTPSFTPPAGVPEVLFAGHHLGGDYLRNLLAYLDGKSVYVNVISKSGTTLEPALAFRIVRDWMNSRFGDTDERIIVTTDPERGVLNEMHRRHGYRKFVIPESVGGRFSVLTPVGLLPIRAAGIDAAALVRGAADGCRALEAEEDNPAITYAAVRNELLGAGYPVELLAAFDPRLGGLQEWWQQLFGESEGKQHKGLYPSIARYTTDLHSLGQYVQEGQRILIETILLIGEDDAGIAVSALDDDVDGLNYLAGRTLHAVNRAAYEGTAEAHADGGVPTLAVEIPRLSAEELGACLYFFEHAVAVSGYMLGINPFDQPGVEAYKRNMFRLLRRQGR